MQLRLSSSVIPTQFATIRPYVVAISPITTTGNRSRTIVKYALKESVDVSHRDSKSSAGATQQQSEGALAVRDLKRKCICSHFYCC